MRRDVVDDLPLRLTQEVVDRSVEALRGAQARGQKQARRTAWQPDGGVCACWIIAQANGFEAQPDTIYAQTERNVEIERVYEFMKAIGFDRVHPEYPEGPYGWTAIAGRNDSGHTFADIATFLETFPVVGDRVDADEFDVVAEAESIARDAMKAGL